MRNGNRRGYFIISLDFELLWGVFDKVKAEEKVDYFVSTRTVITEMLNLFSKYEISCTWAVVGMLFNEDWHQWKSNIPRCVPEYTNEKLSAYQFGIEFQSVENSQILCFAKDIIRQIKVTPGQEIGSHTYSHYYCLEDGQNIESFKADLNKGIELAEREGIAIRSLVFPRNQFNEKYLELCAEAGVENVRSNPDAWYWKDTSKETLITRIFRTGDAYFGMNNKSYDLETLVKDKYSPLSQKASRLFRPYSKVKILNHLKLKRLKSEMTSAARKGEVYHLWWHPHNFSNNTEENLNDLSSILEHFNKLRTQYGFQSENMQSLNEIIKRRNGK